MSTVEIHGEQWKLEDIQENIEWAKSQHWSHKKYENTEGHEHCLICYWTIFSSENPDDSSAYHFGGSTWLCNECYTKFIKEI